MLSTSRADNYQRTSGVRDDLLMVRRCSMDSHSVTGYWEEKVRKSNTARARAKTSPSFMYLETYWVFPQKYALLYSGLITRILVVLRQRRITTERSPDRGRLRLLGHINVKLTNLSYVAAPWGSQPRTLPRGNRRKPRTCRIPTRRLPLHPCRKGTTSTMKKQTLEGENEWRSTPGASPDDRSLTYPIPRLQVSPGHLHWEGR